MEKEISSGSMLCIVIMALAATTGLFAGILSIAKNVAEDTVANTPEEVITDLPNITLRLAEMENFFVSNPCLTIGLIIGVSLLFSAGFLFYKNRKLSMWDNIPNKHKNIVLMCDVDNLEDSTEVALPKKVSFLKAIRCKFSDVADVKSIGFHNSQITHIKGTVKTVGNFYKIGDNSLARGVILLEEGKEVDFKIRSKVSLETALGIYRIFELV